MHTKIANVSVSSVHIVSIIVNELKCIDMDKNKRKLISYYINNYDCYVLIRDRVKMNSFIIICSKQSNQPESLLIIRRKVIK